MTQCAFPTFGNFTRIMPVLLSMLITSPNDLFCVPRSLIKSPSLALGNMLNILHLDSIDNVRVVEGKVLVKLFNNLLCDFPYVAFNVF